MELKRTTKYLLKIAISIFALWFISTKIDLAKLLEIVKNASIVYIFLAFIFFNLSKTLSSIRLNLFFKSLGLNLSEFEALKLYYTGMFYNLFLPGGVGGDGYKIYLLNRSSNANLKDLTIATVLDRVSGLLPLIFLAGLLFLFSKFLYGLKYLIPFDIAILFLIFPVAWLIYRYLFSQFFDIFISSTIFGFGTQILQIISAFFILKAVGVDSFFLEFIILFLISSIVAVLPISIGGVGVREAVFIYGLGALGLPSESGVAFGVIFFLITAVSSFFGLFFSFDTPQGGEKR